MDICVPMVGLACHCGKLCCHHRLLVLVKRNEAAVGDCHFLFLTLAATLRFTCIVVDAVDLDLVKRNENNGGL